MSFQKAEKKKSWLRLGIAAPSGGGKTYTSLRIATGIAKEIGSKVAVIDSEKGSASLYADKFEFDVLELDNPYTVDKYVEAIKSAEKAGYKVLLVDSMSHAWKRILEEIELLTNTKYKGNSYRAWSEGTPMYEKLVDAMLSFKGHIIMTSRSKTEYVQEKDSNGRTVINKVGLGVQNRADFEYECTMFLEGTHDHYFTFSKDRTGKYQDKIIHKPDEKLGEELVEWLNGGVEIKETLQDVLGNIENEIGRLMADEANKPKIAQAIKDAGCTTKISEIKDIEIAKAVLNKLKGGI
jgi:hypothetical protein